MEQTAKKTGKTYEMDMCNGPLFPKIVAFAVPLILSGILQLLFNAADIIVVGHFAGRESLAAVGSTTALINLMINVFVGLSIGANVLVAQYSGAQKWKDLEETVHTAMMIALAGGILLIFVGVFFSGPMLSLMGTPDDVLPLAALYLKIYFVGMPATLTYNFGAAILRAVGDTRRPLYFLLFAGAVNVVLNLVFVIGFSMGVAGVATATVVSECISAVLIVRCLARSNSAYRLYREKMHLTESKVKLIMKIGLPAGFQGAIFSVSNVLIQSSGRKHSFSQCGGFCIQCHERGLPDCPQLYQPELWSGKDEPCDKNSFVLSWSGGHGGCCDGRRCGADRSEITADLFL